MKYLEQLVLYLFPKLLFSNKSWFYIWKKQEIDEFFSASKLFFASASIVYIAHYFFVDKSEGLAPSTLWFNYRFGMAAIAAICFLFYSFKENKNKFYNKVPLLLACATFTYFQTKTILWYPKVPYLYSFAFVLISSLLIRSTLLNSVLYALSLLVLIWPVLLEANQSSSMMFSASIVTIIFVMYMKGKYVSDLNLFIANQKNLDNQKKIIEINMEFTNQIKSFLPSEISKRLTYCIQEQRMSVLQAIDEVLRPKKMNVACLFSDIRGFTKGVSDLDGFVTKSLLPNIKSATLAVERFNGIPRKIGDLIFAYYDSDNFHENIRNVIKTAFEINALNSEINNNLPDHLKIKRYILISAGEAIVGNLSGYDSNIEITAIGKPVNLLSRLDETTKVQNLRELLSDGDIILTPEINDQINLLYPDIQTQKISLSNISVKIRDFEFVTDIYILPVTNKNYNLLFKIEAINTTNAEIKKWIPRENSKKIS